MTNASHTILISMSPEDLKGLMMDCISNALSSPNGPKPTQHREARHVYGIHGLARLLHCSNPTAQKLKNSGRIPYKQAGRKLVFDVDEVLKALEKQPMKKRA